VATSKKSSKKPAAKKAASDGSKKAAKKTTRRKKVEAGSRGLSPTELQEGDAPDEVEALAKAVVKDGGAVLDRYRDPLGGNWQLFASIPIDKLVPSPFQRDRSTAHAKRMVEVIDKLGRFLDPVIAVRTEEGM
jgi:ParB family chromosome partitioning protein